MDVNPHELGNLASDRPTAQPSLHRRAYTNSCTRTTRARAKAAPEARPRGPVRLHDRANAVGANTVWKTKSLKSTLRGATRLRSNIN